MFFLCRFLHLVYIIFIHFILENPKEKGHAHPLSQKDEAGIIRPVSALNLLTY